MDDVLSKPLAVPALTAMIKKFWDTCDEEESTMTSVDSAKVQTLLDTAMLEQYIDLVGPKLITDGLAVFEKMMPGYLSVLESNLTARDQKGIVEEGIRLKAQPVRWGYAISSSWANRFNPLIYLHGKIT